MQRRTEEEKRSRIRWINWINWGWMELRNKSPPWVLVIKNNAAARLVPSTFKGLKCQSFPVKVFKVKDFL